MSTRTVSRRLFLRAGVVAAAMGTASVIAVERASPVNAFSTGDATTRLRTAAAIENAAAQVCRSAGRLSLMSLGAGGRAVQVVIGRLGSNHRDQAKLLNDAAAALGADAETGADGPVLDRFAPRIARATSLADVLQALADLENVAAGSCAAYAGEVGDADAIKALMVIGPIHAQDAVVLAALAATAAISEDLLARNPDLTALRRQFGSVGSPAALLDLSVARPAGEGP